MSTNHRIPFGQLEPATFLRRPNRFLGWVELDGREVKAHVPDPGRLTELLFSGANVFVRRHGPDSGKKTECAVVLVDAGTSLVSIDTQMPNRLIREALEAERMEELKPYEGVRPEWTHGGSRFDFALEERDGSQSFVEVKSVSWRKGDTGWFPDARTARGARHVMELTELRRSGRRTAIVFVAQRGDVEAVAADPEVDPTFAAALSGAAEAGVHILAWRSDVALDSIALDRRIPVLGFPRTD